MQIGKTLYVSDRKAWRAWLAKNHKKEKEIWLVYYRKSAGKPRIPYNDAVEEALCYGWIDSIEKGIDEERFAQRFSPRRPGSVLSETNIARLKQLIKEKKMTPAGLAAVAHAFDPGKHMKEKYVIPQDILKELKKDKKVWSNFQTFSDSYKRIRIGWIDGARSRPEEFNKRLKNFLKKTAVGKKFGMIQ